MFPSFFPRPPLCWPERASQTAAETRQVYLCGRILDPAAYDAACRSRGRLATEGFFPAYRAA